MVINTQKCSLSRICGRGPALVILPGRVAIHYDGTGKWSPSLHQKLKNLVYKCWPKAVDKFSPTTDAGRLLGPIEAHFRVVFEGVRPGRSVATEPHSETHSDHIKTSGPGCTHCSSWVSLLTGRIWRILNLTFSPSGVSRKGGYWSRREPSSPKTVRNGGRCEARLVVLGPRGEIGVDLTGTTGFGAGLIIFPKQQDKQMVKFICIAFWAIFS